MGYPIRHSGEIDCRPAGCFVVRSRWRRGYRRVVLSRLILAVFSVPWSIDYGFGD